MSQIQEKAPESRVLFTKEMRKTHTLLVPGMAPIHFALFKNVMEDSGYKVAILDNEGSSVVQEGLMYVHNDTCYPALLVIGQMIDALKSGKYDLDHVALAITQTGGGCRASNYIHLLRKALHKAGFSHIPVVSMNLSRLESNPGFKITISMLRKVGAALAYGDEMMQLYNQIRPYEINKGDTAAMLAKWTKDLSEKLNRGHGYSLATLEQNMKALVADFASIPVDRTRKKTKVGIVGEIYVKYSSLGNNHLEDFLFNHDCEYMVPGIMGFALFKTDNRLEDHKLYGGNPLKKIAVKMLYDYLTKIEDRMIAAFKPFLQLIPPFRYAHTKEVAKGVIGYGSKMGEGWLLTAEMIELSEIGYGNIVCAQPFGCLPNHIVGKGMVRKIKELHPNSNIVPIDYDPSATRVNQENRIKLMLAVAAESPAPRAEKTT